MTRTAFNHEWRGLWQQENDTYRYREEEWGDKLFPRELLWCGTMQERLGS